MAIDTAEKRKSISGIGWLLPGVTPNSEKDQEWRQESGWSYSGIAAASPVVPPVVITPVAEVAREIIRDLGRDLNIGIPPVEIQQINVVLAPSIIAALKGQVASRLNKTNHLIRKLLRTLKRILGMDVEGE